MDIKLNLSLLKKVVEELKSKITGNHIAHISVINSSDILMQFSFYVKEKLFISLSHQNPIISLINKDFSSPTIMGGLSDNLRKNLKGTFISDISILNNDRILKFVLQKTNDFFEKEDMSLIIELIPTRSNLIILDKHNKIIYAYHYSDITHSHPIIRGMEYALLESNKNYKEQESVSLEEYKNYVHKYLLHAESKRKKESQKPLYSFLITKRKSLIKKIDVLKREKKEAEDGLIYKEYGEMIYAYLYDEDSLNKYVEENLKDIYDTSKSPSENANIIFEKYKKNKRTIEHDIIEINKAESEIEELNNTINLFDYLDEDEINELYNKYMVHRGQKARKIKTNPKLPFYVKTQQITIGFGKNATQNDYLTFKKARKTDTFLHINEYTGSHVIIFDQHPSNEVLLTASEICLILSNKTTGDIKYSLVSDIKKGPTSGQVIVEKYKLITLRDIRLETYELLKTQKRFID